MSIKTKHTPGPWHTEGWEGLIVATPSGETMCCAGGTRKSDLNELKANAALIAAAPDLLAGVEAMDAAARETGQNIPIELAPAWGRLWEAAQKAKGGGE